MAELHARYERLSPDEQRILRVLSVVCESVGQTVLQQILDALAWHDRAGTPLSRLLNKTLRERLCSDGLIDLPKGALFCRPDLRETLTRETVADGTFATIVEAAERCFPTPLRNSWEQPSEMRRLRVLRNALYSGCEDEVLQGLGIGPAASLARVPYHQVRQLAEVCLSQPDPKWIPVSRSWPSPRCCTRQPWNWSCKRTIMR